MLPGAESLPPPADALQRERLKSVSNLDKVAILAEALPYLQQFHGAASPLYGAPTARCSSQKAGRVADTAHAVSSCIAAL